MAQKSKRKRRASLRGWWNVLPFLASPTLLLMTFAHWEAGRLQNQYQRSERLGVIQDLRKEIDYLYDQDRELNRIEVMDKKAPGWGLGEPDPDQVVIVSRDEIEKTLSGIEAYRRDYREAELGTRTVLLHVTYEDELLAKELDAAAAARATGTR
ncbi:MAG: hypothetical protein VCB26_09520 [Candidatus Hydrogenedentota bacterium]